MSTGLHFEHHEAHGDLPLVLLHGWGMNLRVFDALRARLAVPDRALDLPGHGRSPWQPARAHFEAQLDDLACAMPARSVVLAWSLGAQFAMALARRFPHRVAGLVLIAATPRFAAAPDWPHGLAADAVASFRAMLDQDWQQTLDDFIWLQLRGSRHAEAVQQRIRTALQEHGAPRREALAAGLAILATQDLRPLIARIAQPTLVITGQNDRVTPPAAGEWLAGALPRARHVSIARAGHAPFLSHVEETASAVREHLDVVARAQREPLPA